LAYQIEISDAALIDAEEYVRFLRMEKSAEQAARRWFRELMAAIFSLEKMPRRCPRIPEAEEFSTEIRHLIHASHRIIFHVDNRRHKVTVLRVYHGARRPIHDDDL